VELLYLLVVVLSDVKSLLCRMRVNRGIWVVKVES